MNYHIIKSCTKRTSNILIKENKNLISERKTPWISRELSRWRPLQENSEINKQPQYTLISLYDEGNTYPRPSTSIPTPSRLMMMSCWSQWSDREDFSRTLERAYIRRRDSLSRRSYPLTIFKFRLSGTSTWRGCCPHWARYISVTLSNVNFVRHCKKMSNWISIKS